MRSSIDETAIHRARLSSVAFSGAVARLMLLLVGMPRAWRARGVDLLRTSRQLAHDIETLRFVGGTLRSLHVAQLSVAARDANAQAMRLHNLLPEGDARGAAFDGAAHAAAVELMLAELDSERAASPSGTSTGDGIAAA